MPPKDSPLTARVTIRTVAADAGVSVAAVSKVLRDAYGVSEALRTRVTASIERLGYRPSRAAQGLRGRSRTVGILLTGIDNPFLVPVLDGISEVLEPSGLSAMFGVGRTVASLETRLIEQMIDFGMEGLILVAPLLDGRVLDAFARHVPIVVVAHHEPGAQSFDTVSADDRAGGRLATEALLARGHEAPVMLSLQVSHAPGVSVSDQRELGYRDAMAAAGRSQLARVEQLASDPSVAEVGMAALLDRPDRPRAVFCWSDLHGIPLLGVAARRGLRVPQDLAIVGFDNSAVAALPLVDLASIDQDGHAQGVRAARALLSRIEGRRDPEHVVIEPRLVERRSL